MPELSAEALARSFPGLSQAAGATDGRVIAAVQQHVELVNRDLASVETVKKFRLLPASFTIETGELTPSLKVKRKVVADKFAAEIEALYSDGEAG